MKRLLLASACLTAASLAVAAAAAGGARPPRLPNLTGYFRGQRPAVRALTFRGVRFACFDFVARDGVLTECFAVGRAAARRPPSGPAA